MRIAYLTAGAGGMYCGSCMRDNTLVRAMTSIGLDAVLVSTYTPIRTDEEDVSIDQVFLGGINVYLQQKMPLMRWLPGWADRFLDRPGLIRWATRGSVRINAQQLGALTVSMLQGVQGRQRKEVRRLCDWLGKDLDPEVVILSNLLIGGCVPELRRVGHRARHSAAPGGGQGRHACCPRFPAVVSRADSRLVWQPARLPPVQPRPRVRRLVGPWRPRGLR